MLRFLWELESSTEGVVLLSCEQRLIYTCMRMIQIVLEGLH